ncbi:outer membrane porin GjpA [Mycolicibacterium tokaiense]|uniref:PE-PGRS family protein n=1 Tax=Mycolicibacterium tokaiense TaxID=39695 RepID=A0A378TGU7_9MYCO|nr:outer membrane porin GjpA [Mycolicibacterium tokaiense]BBY85732.1 hypothetical protein MTOK_15140 [Mycolicibacterium tokaiense]STZ59754.1 Uncharacterised protein [Mycolicibacterium tokaiense]
MHAAARSSLAAGVALVSAGAIAVSPVHPPVLRGEAVSPSVQLSAAIDPITPWLETFNDAEINFANLAAAWLEAPAPVLQQIIANQIGYLSQLPDFPAIAEQIAQNTVAAIQAPFAEDLSTLDSLHAIIYDLLLNGLPPIIDPVVPANLTPLVEFSTTYLSGVLLGLVGPIINPVLALGGSLQSVVDNLTSSAPDIEAALNTVINTPAAMVDAFLNGGQSIDITPLLNAVGVESPLPGLTFSADLVFGGLLSPGGSIFNALTIDLGDGSGPIGVGPGALGSLIGMAQQIAKALGWDGTGNPLAPPLDTPEPATSEVDAVTATPSKNAALVNVDLPTAAPASGPEIADPAAEAPAADIEGEGDSTPAQPQGSDSGTATDDEAAEDVEADEPVTETEDESTEESAAADEDSSAEDEDSAEGSETEESSPESEPSSESTDSTESNDSSGSDDGGDASSNDSAAE